MITAIYIGTDRLDLFEDENIVINSNITKISDITKVFTDTSNTFTVPATDVNNDIFKHWYNPNLLNGFDARKKVPAVIELSGVNFKVGKIKLNKVNVKNGKPYTYSLDYFGNLVELKDLVGNDLLTSLDLSSLNFTYSSANVKNKLQSVSDVCFSLLSNRRLLFDSSNTTIDNETQTNIYYDGNNNNTGIDARDLNASIRQLKIIEAIESKYNLTFSRDFLGAYDFSNQFLCLSNEKDTSTSNIIALTNQIGDPDPTKSGNVLLATGLGTPEQRETFDISLTVNIDSGSVGKEYSMYIKNNGIIISKKEKLTNSASITVFQSEINVDFNEVTFFIETSEIINYNSTIIRGQRFTLNEYEYTSGPSVTSSTFDVSQKLPNIKIIDYLSGLFKISKLIAYVEDDGDIFVDNLSNYYSNGKLYDITDYIDDSNYPIATGKLLNRINYQFSDPKTILNNEFKEQNNLGYGDLKFDVKDENGNLIEGGTLDFKLPFEQILYEKIIDINDSTFDTNIQYGLILDKELKKVEIKPHIHYIENKITSCKYINSDGSATNLLSANIPVHVLDLSSQLYSTTFGNEFNTFNGVLIEKTLYSNYHKDFIESVFSERKREYNFKAKDLPTIFILQLKLNDVIQIKEDYYRIESFSVNTTNNDVDFKLINDRVVNVTPIKYLTGDNTIITGDSDLITSDQTIY